MNFPKLMRAARIVVPEEKILGFVFPFYELTEVTPFKFFGRVTKVDNNEKWVVTPLKSEIIRLNGKHLVCKVSEEASGDDFTETYHSGRRIFISEPYDSTKHNVPKDFWDGGGAEYLYKAEFTMRVKDMNNAVIPMKIISDGML